MHAGSYWELDKRRSDLAEMAPGWRRWAAAMDASLPDLVNDADVLALPARLEACAQALHDRLGREPSLREGGFGTLLHGDFKTANLFFRRAAALPSHAANGGASVMQSAGDCVHGPASDGDAMATANGAAAVSTGVSDTAAHAGVEALDAAAYAGLAVTACDLQWVGPGAALQDVQYLLWTSVQPGVVAAEEAALLSHYLTTLRAAARAHFGDAHELPDDAAAQRLYDVRLFCCFVCVLVRM